MSQVPFRMVVKKMEGDNPRHLRVAFNLDLDTLMKVTAGIAIVGNLDPETLEFNSELFTKALRYVNETDGLMNVGVPWLGPATLEDNRSHVVAISESLKAAGWKFHTPTPAEIEAYIRENG